MAHFKAIQSIRSVQSIQSDRSGRGFSYLLFSDADKKPLLPGGGKAPVIRISRRPYLHLPVHIG